MTKAAAPKFIAANAALCTALNIADGAPPTRIQFFPIGQTKTHNGVPPKIVVADKPHAQRVIDATRLALGTSDLMIDYDHQAPATIKHGVRAAAAGWVNPASLIVEDDGIWGDVEWNAAAASQIAAREYRYISPYFLHLPDGTVLSIINAALVNMPNLPLAAVASALPNQKDEDQMDLKAIATALGLPEAADQSAILAAIATAKTKADALGATASALGVTLGDDVSVVATAAASALAAKPDPAKFVPLSDLQAVTAQMTAMQASLDGIEDGRREALVDKAIADKLLLPAQKAWASALAKSDEAAFATYLAGANPINLAASAITAKGAAGDDGLTESELATASGWGHSPEDYLKSRTALEGAV